MRTTHAVEDWWSDAGFQRRRERRYVGSESGLKQVDCQIGIQKVDQGMADLWFGNQASSLRPQAQVAMVQNLDAWEEG